MSPAAAHRAGRTAIAFWSLIALATLLAGWMTFALTERRDIPAHWRTGPHNGIELSSSSLPVLQPATEQLASLRAPDQPPLTLTADSLVLPGQWQTTRSQRDLSLVQQRGLHTLMQQPAVTLQFRSGLEVQVHPRRVGLKALGLGYWLLMGLAGVLFVTGALVLTRHPVPANQAYALIALAQVANLVMMAAASTGGLTQPLPFLAHDYVVRTAADLLTIAAMVQAMILHPVSQPHRQWLGWASWAVAAMPVLFIDPLGDSHWWVTRAVVGALGLLALWTTYRAHQDSRHPLGGFFMRVGAATLGIWASLSIGIAAADQATGAPRLLAAAGTVLWSVFIAVLLILMPYLARSRQLLREFALLTAVTTVASVLNLLLISVFGVDALTALTATVLSAVLGYTVTRQWLLDRSIGRETASSDQLVEKIYATLDESRTHGERSSALASALLGSVFEPRQIAVIARRQLQARVSRDGATLTVPLQRDADPAQPEQAIEMQFAHGGQRLFTLEDARAADRIVDQFRHAVAFQRARDQGRTEERVRLAQDLHDDIGARLLTLMYKAPTPEMEDYIRHTLQDLKTLSRGLASGNHRLGDAAAEWRNDAGHRLDVVRCKLQWVNEIDEDITLTVVQWSTLTRVLRELITNTIAHANASRVVVRIALQQGDLEITVDDDGIGGAPDKWSHGLGLAGIRKRIKQLGGDVQWLASPRGGILAQVRVNGFAKRG